MQEETGGVPSSDFVRGVGIDELLAHSNASGTRYPLLDALGSPIAYVDAAGTIQAQSSYEPFGATTVTGASSQLPSVAFTGSDMDTTDLYYYRARYLNPETGRFISEDPLGLSAGTNFYAYVDNDPLGARDPSGTLSVNVTGPVINTWQSLDSLVMACGQLIYFGCGGLKNFSMTCTCVPDGCGKYRPNIAISGRLEINAYARHPRAKVEEIIREEMKHVVAAQKALEKVKQNAARFEQKLYDWEWACKWDCWWVVRQNTNLIDSAIGDVHRTDPHPKR